MSLPAPPPLLAVDLGTTNVKAVLVGADGRVLATEAVRCAASALRSRAVQDPAGLLRAAETAVANAVSRVQPAALVLSSAMHGVLPLDAAGEPLGPLSTWADPLGGELGRELRADGRAAALHERTGTPIHPCNLTLRIPELRERLDAAARARVQTWVSGKELLLRRWLDARVVDASLASATGLFDPVAGAWYDAALALAGVEVGQLARVVPTDHVVTSWRPAVLRALGLRRPVPVVVGASDGVLAHLGVGGDDHGVCSLTLGTSGAARRALPASRRGARKIAPAGLFRYVLDGGTDVVGGAVSHVGRCLEWVAKLFHAAAPPDQQVAMLLRAAAPRSGRPAAPRFVPRLGAERFPDHELDDRPHGAWTGLGYDHDVRDLQRAALDGVLEAVAGIVRATDDHATSRGVLRCGGGLARSPLVVQRVADLLHRPVAVATSVESSALGAVRLGRRALGLRDPFVFEPAAEYEPEQADAAGGSDAR